jgi:hypothetical protein
VLLLLLVVVVVDKVDRAGGDFCGLARAKVAETQVSALCVVYG